MAAGTAGAGGKKPRCWYGSHTLIDGWVDHLMQPQTSSAAK